jgi:hypothetical protein
MKAKSTVAEALGVNAMHDEHAREERVAELGRRDDLPGACGTTSH